MSGNRDELDIYERAARVQRNTGDGEVNDRVQEEISDDGGSTSDNDSNDSDSSGDRSFSRDPSEMVDRSGGSSSDNNGRSFSPGPGDRQPASSGSSEQDNSPPAEPNRSDPRRDGSSRRADAVDDTGSSGPSGGSSDPVGGNTGGGANEATGSTSPSSGGSSGSSGGGSLGGSTELDPSDPLRDGSSRREDAVGGTGSSGGSDNTGGGANEATGSTSPSSGGSSGGDGASSSDELDPSDPLRDGSSRREDAIDDTGSDDASPSSGGSLEETGGRVIVAEGMADAKNVIQPETFDDLQQQTESEIDADSLFIEDGRVKLTENAREEEAEAIEAQGQELRNNLGPQGQRKQEQARRDRVDEAAAALESDLEQQVGRDLERGEDFTIQQEGDRITATVTADGVDSRREAISEDLGAVDEISVGQRPSGESNGPEPAVDPFGATVDAVGQSLDTTAVAGGEGGQETIQTVEEEFGEAGRELTQAAQGNREDLEEQDLGEGDGVAGTVGQAFESGVFSFGVPADRLGTDLAAAVNAPEAISQGASVAGDVDDLLMTTTVAGGEGGEETISTAEEDAQQVAATADRFADEAQENPADVAVPALLGAGVGTAASSTIRGARGIDSSGPGTTRRVVDGARDRAEGAADVAREIADDDRAMAGLPNQRTIDPEVDSGETIRLEGEDLDVDTEPRRPPEERTDLDDEGVRRRQTERNRRNSEDDAFDAQRGDSVMERRARRRRGARDIERETPDADARAVDTTRRQTPDSDLRERRQAAQRQEVLAGGAAPLGGGVAGGLVGEQTTETAMSSELREDADPSAQQRFETASTFVGVGNGIGVGGTGQSVGTGIESEIEADSGTFGDLGVGVGTNVGVAANTAIGSDTQLNTGAGTATDPVLDPTPGVVETGETGTETRPASTRSAFERGGRPRFDPDPDGQVEPIASEPDTAAAQSRRGDGAGATGFVEETLVGFGVGGLSIEPAQASESGEGLLPTIAGQQEQQGFEQAEDLFTFGGEF